VPSDVEAIRGLADELRRIATTTGDVDEFLRVDRVFHDTIARASGNEVLRQMIRNVHGYLTRAWSRITIADGEIEHLAGLHVDIADAIAAGDEARAGEAMSGHLSRALAKELARHAPQGVL
jgi:DNA-binding FadR family transcriptional regulator